MVAARGPWTAPDASATARHRCVRESSSAWLEVSRHWPYLARQPSRVMPGVVWVPCQSTRSERPGLCLCVSDACVWVLPRQVGWCVQWRLLNADMRSGVGCVQELRRPPGSCAVSSPERCKEVVWVSGPRKGWLRLLGRCGQVVVFVLGCGALHVQVLAMSGINPIRSSARHTLVLAFWGGEGGIRCCMPVRSHQTHGVPGGCVLALLACQSRAPFRLECCQAATAAALLQCCWSPRRRVCALADNACALTCCRMWPRTAEAHTGLFYGCCCVWTRHEQQGGESLLTRSAHMNACGHGIAAQPGTGLTAACQQHC